MGGGLGGTATGPFGYRAVLVCTLLLAASSLLLVYTTALPFLCAHRRKHRADLDTGHNGLLLVFAYTALLFLTRPCHQAAYRFQGSQPGYRTGLRGGGPVSGSCSLAAQASNPYAATSAAAPLPHTGDSRSPSPYNQPTGVIKHPLAVDL